MLREVRIAFRTLLRDPLFTLASIASLALGIGANTAIFSLLDAVVWRRLPVPRPERLVRVTLSTASGARPVPWDFYKALEHDPQLFAGVFLRVADGISFSSGGRAERVVADFVSGRYFSSLGVKPAVGR